MTANEIENQKNSYTMEIENELAIIKELAAPLFSPKNDPEWFDTISKIELCCSNCRKAKQALDDLEFTIPDEEDSDNPFMSRF